MALRIRTVIGKPRRNKYSTMFRLTLEPIWNPEKQKAQRVSAEPLKTMVPPESKETKILINNSRYLGVKKFIKVVLKAVPIVSVLLAATFAFNVSQNSYSIAALMNSETSLRRLLSFVETRYVCNGSGISSREI